MNTSSLQTVQISEILPRKCFILQQVSAPAKRGNTFPFPVGTSDWVDVNHTQLRHIAAAIAPFRWLNSSSLWTVQISEIIPGISSILQEVSAPAKIGNTFIIPVGTSDWVDVNHTQLSYIAVARAPLRWLIISSLWTVKLPKLFLNILFKLQYVSAPAKLGNTYHISVGPTIYTKLCHTTAAKASVVWLSCF